MASALETLVYIPYAAPEVLRQEDFTEKTDVFSFGMVLWEMFARVEPYSGMDTARIAEYVLSGGRPAIPADLPESLAALIQRCWAVRSHLFVVVYVLMMMWLW